MKKSVIAILIGCAGLSAQSNVPVYRVSVTARTVKAVSYQHRTGETKVDFAGTSLMPNAHGTAKVEGKKGFIAIDAEFRDMPEATQFGGEYLTYVLWAVTPEGRTSNLGEILRDGSSGKLSVTTELQTFALIVTAEPYFAVSKPSDVVALENVVRRDTNGGVEPVDAKFELFERGQYLHLANVLDLQVSKKLPLEIYEARNAVQIARKSGADKFAADTFQKAESQMKQAEAYRINKAGSKPVTMAAREAVQTAEDSRAIAVKRQDDDVLAAERQAGADRTARAESEADRVTREAAAAKASAQAEAERMKLRHDEETLAAQREADRLKKLNDDKMMVARNEAAGLKADNDAQRLAAQAELARVGSEKDRLEREKVALRAQLFAQFNLILQTRDTARGLIVNMSDVLFDTGKFTLRPEAREKLARVAGIVEGHPGLKLAVEGYTDSVGGDDYNQQLSEHRGGSVRDDLIQQGMPNDSVSSTGFGKNNPVATNDTAEGRQQNRRVEMVISGDVIGYAIGVTPDAK